MTRNVTSVKRRATARVCRSAGRQSASPQSRDARDRRYRRAAKWVGSGVTPSDNATTDNATMGPDDLLCNVNSLALGSGGRILTKLE